MTDNIFSQKNYMYLLRSLINIGVLTLEYLFYKSKSGTVFSVV